MEHNKSSWISWGVVVAGVLTAALSYTVLMALGAALGGFTASHILAKGGTGSGLMTGAGLWTGGSSVLALFLGSYFAIRFSDIKHRQLAACQAIVIAAAFFVVILNGIGIAMIGTLSGLSTALIMPELSDGEAVGAAGALLFVTFVLSIVAAIVGGIEGTIGNVRRPLIIRRPTKIVEREVG